MFDVTLVPRKKIAIVGGGISGMAAAYYLSPYHDVTLYEAEARLGGHARTVVAGKRGDQPVDTGFIVFNYETYPFLTELFGELDVPVTKAEMSFGATINNGELEYGLSNLRAIVAQPRNLFRPKYYKMISDILRFGRRAEAAVQCDTKTISELVKELRLGQWFMDRYLLPMCGAIWSTPINDVGQFPARTLVQFFRNHALLAGQKQHQWWTVNGGSIEYVRRLEAALLGRGCSIRTGTPVSGMKRHPAGVTVLTAHDRPEQFDDIIFACHSDQALRILGTQATQTERAALGAIRYQTNRAVLHCDTNQMPRRRDCWSSWSYRSQEGAIGVTYWMNRLQSIPESDPLFVTLNPTTPIDRDKIYDDVNFAHPLFDAAALKAQKDISNIQGENATWFAGAWNRHGFHEDGIASARKIASLINEPAQNGVFALDEVKRASTLEFLNELKATA